MTWLLHALAHFFGLDNASGAHYLAWSGVGSDVTELVFFGGLYAGLRKINCHTKGCWRIGKHHVEGTPYVVCKKHHPHVPDKGATLEEIHQAHKSYRVGQMER